MTYLRWLIGTLITFVWFFSTVHVQMCSQAVCPSGCKVMVSWYIWICGLDYSKSNSKVRFQDLSGLSPLVKIYTFFTTCLSGSIHTILSSVPAQLCSAVKYIFEWIAADTVSPFIRKIILIFVTKKHTGHVIYAVAVVWLSWSCLSIFLFTKIAINYCWEVSKVYLNNLSSSFHSPKKYHRPIYKLLGHSLHPTMYHRCRGVQSCWTQNHSPLCCGCLPKIHPVKNTHSYEKKTWILHTSHLQWEMCPWKSVQPEKLKNVQKTFHLQTSM